MVDPGISWLSDLFSRSEPAPAQQFDLQQLARNVVPLCHLHSYKWLPRNLLGCARSYLLVCSVARERNSHWKAEIFPLQGLKKKANYPPFSICTACRKVIHVTLNARTAANQKQMGGKCWEIPVSQGTLSLGTKSASQQSDLKLRSAAKERLLQYCRTVWLKQKNAAGWKLLPFGLRSWVHLHERKACWLFWAIKNHIWDCVAF